MNYSNIDPAVYSISPELNFLFVYWLLGSTCTYKCSYCHPIFNDGNHPYHSKEIILKTLDVFPKNTRIMFGGGEPSYHPDIEEIFRKSPDSVALGLLSNGSRPISFWERIYESLGFLMLTYHIEYAKLDKFVALAELTREKLKRINLPMVPREWKRCVEVYEHLRSLGLPVTPKPLIEDFGFKATSLNLSYSTPQRLWMQNQEEVGTVANFYNSDKEVIQSTNASTMLIKNQTNFNGWQCEVSKNCLNIGFDGTVFDTNCSQRRNLGSIYDKFELDNKGMVCEQTFCWGHSDIVGSKHRIL